MSADRRAAPVEDRERSEARRNLGPEPKPASKFRSSQSERGDEHRRRALARLGAQTVGGGEEPQLLAATRRASALLINWRRN